MVEISNLKDTELECSHTVKLRNLVPKVLQSKKRTERKKAIKNLFFKKIKRNAMPRIRALVKISSVLPPPLMCLRQATFWASWR